MSNININCYNRVIYEGKAAKKVYSKAFIVKSIICYQQIVFQSVNLLRLQDDKRVNYTHIIMIIIDLNNDWTKSSDFYLKAIIFFILKKKNIVLIF